MNNDLKNLENRLAFVAQSNVAQEMLIRAMISALAKSLPSLGGNMLAEIDEEIANIPADSTFVLESLANARGVLLEALGTTAPIGPDVH